MLVPDNHITFSESLLGFGSYIIKSLNKPTTPDKLWKQFLEDHKSKKYRSNQSFDSLILTLDFLYCIGIVELDIESGEVKRCAS